MHYVVRLFAALLMLLLFSFCGRQPVNEDFSDYIISVTIPVEFDQDEQIKDFILTFQALVNEFNESTWRIHNLTVADHHAASDQQEAPSLSKRKLLKVGLLIKKQEQLWQEREALVGWMTKILPSLPEHHQLALRGIIGELDARMGVLLPGGSGETAEPFIHLAESEVIPGHFDEYDHASPDTETAAGRDNSQRWLAFAFFGFLSLLFIIRRKKSRSRTPFFQRISHISSEIVKGFEHISAITPGIDNALTQADREQFARAEKLISSLIKDEPLEHADNLAEAEQYPGIPDYKDLRGLYDNELRLSIAGLEASRRRIARFYLFSFVAFFSGLVSFGLIPLQYGLNIIFGVLLMLAALALVITATVRFLSFRKQYKMSVVSKIVRLINPGFAYDPNKHLTLELFNQAKLIRQFANKATGDDYVKGRIEKTVFEFSELVAQYEYEVTNDEGKKTKQTDTLFNGLFFVIDFNKHIEGETFVISNKTSGPKRRLLTDVLRSAALKSVKLENPAFGKLFSVFSSSQTEARYILTPAIMEGMLNIYHKAGPMISFSFTGDHVYCGIEFNKALFEASVFRPVRYADLEMMHALFSLIETLIKEMNLNTRIWTKE